jgi:hypothetical protein
MGSLRRALRRADRALTLGRVLINARTGSVTRLLCGYVARAILIGSMTGTHEKKDYGATELVAS